MNPSQNQEQWEIEFDQKFKPTPKGETGINLIMRQIIEEHNEDVKAFIRSQVEAAEKRGRIAALEEAEKSFGDWKDSYKGKFWSTAVEKCFQAPFPEVAVQHLIRRINELHAAAIRAEKEKTGV